MVQMWFGFKAVLSGTTSHVKAHKTRKENPDAVYRTVKTTTG